MSFKTNCKDIELILNYFFSKYKAILLISTLLLNKLYWELLFETFFVENRVYLFYFQWVRADLLVLMEVFF